MIPIFIKTDISKSIELITKYEITHKEISSPIKESFSSIKSQIITINNLWDTLDNVPNYANFQYAISQLIHIFDDTQSNNIENRLGELNSIKDKLGEFIIYLVNDLKSINSIVEKTTQSFVVTISALEKEVNTKIDEAIVAMSKVKQRLDNLDQEANGLVEKKVEYQELLQNQSFNLQNKVFSAVFDTKYNELIEEKKWYIYPALLISCLLGIGYLYFFLTNFSDINFNYIHHLMLISVCTPFIFLAVWLFYQTGRVTRLSEIYKYKATLAFTIEVSIAQLEKYNNNKEICAKAFSELLMRLYEIPISNKNDKSIINQSTKELSDLVIEIRKLIDSLKFSDSKNT